MRTEEQTVSLADLTQRRRRRFHVPRKLVAGCLALALVVGGLWVVFFSDYLSADSVEVTGLHGLSAVRVRATAQVPLGRPLARVDVDAVRARVESIGSVRSADVTRAWPHAVRITVVERRPVAVVDRGNGLQAVDEAGVLFGHYGHRPPRLPLVRTDPDTSTDALAGAGQVAAALPADLARKTNYLALGSVDQISLVLHDGRTVVWGSAADSAEKAAVVEVLLTRKVQRVDVSVPGRPTTR
jgi:cell division protein FtsQ